MRSALIASSWSNRSYTVTTSRLHAGSMAGRPTRDPGGEPDRNFTQAIRDVAAHLRQGDFLSGAALFEDWTER